VLSVAAIGNMYVAQFDVKTAYLYGMLEEQIYMKQPVDLMKALIVFVNCCKACMD